MTTVLKSKKRNFSDVCGHVNKNLVQKMKSFFPVKAKILLFSNMNVVILGPQVAGELFRKNDVVNFLEVV